jgi:hypothetical protein
MIVTPTVRFFKSLIARFTYDPVAEKNRLLADREKVTAFLRGRHDPHYVEQANIALAEIDRRLAMHKRREEMDEKEKADAAESKACLEMFFLREKYLPAEKTQKKPMPCF